MLTYRCFKLDWWSPLLQNFIQYLLCYFIKTEKRILQSQIACHTFLCLSPPRPMWNWLMESRDMPKELGLFYFAFLTVWLYIQLEEIISVQVTLKTLYHQLPSILYWFKKVTSEPLEHCDFVDPQGPSWWSPYKTCNNLDYLQIEVVKINPHREKNLVVPTVCGFSKQTISQLIHQRFGHVYITGLKRMAIKGLMEGPPENLPELEDPCPICLLTNSTKIPRGLRRLHLNLLNIVNLLTLKVLLGDHPTRLATILTVFNSKLSRSILTETRILLSQLSVEFQSKISLNWFINVLVTSQSLD